VTAAIATEAITPAAPAERSELLGRFPSRPVATSWSATEAPRTATVNRLLAPPFALENRPSQLQGRRPGVLAVVSWLQARPGETWQERWMSSGAEQVTDWRRLVDATTARRGSSTARPPGHLAPGLLVMICGT
jgi:hypothetical protein